MDELQRALDVAIAAAKQAEDVQMKYWRSAFETQLKGGNVRDLITTADKESDRIIQQTIREAFPEHGINSEESPLEKAEYLWHIDPIDGTTNFARGRHEFCSSIALTKGNDVLVAVVNAPVRKELYTAIAGQGAFRNGEKLSVSTVSRFEEAVVGTDFSYTDDNRNKIVEMVHAFIPSRSIRSHGSAALAMCDVASGILDSYAHTHGHTWDFAAGVLLVREAGGRVSAKDGRDFVPLEHRGMLATNGALHEDILGRL